MNTNTEKQFFLLFSSSKHHFELIFLFFWQNFQKPEKPIFQSRWSCSNPQKRLKLHNILFECYPIPYETIWSIQNRGFFVCENSSPLLNFPFSNFEREMQEKFQCWGIDLGGRDWENLHLSGMRSAKIHLFWKFEEENI